MAKIFLAFVEAGHFLTTPGKETPFMKSLGRKVKEHEFNEPTAQFLITELKRCGVHVFDAAPGERDTPLKERTTYANQIYWQYCNKYGKKNVICIYVSIHFNALDGSFEGANPSGFSVHINPGSVEGRKLAQSVLDELKKGTKQINKGIVEQDLHVTRETVMPAILSENGFMDNITEANLMLNKDYQLEVAREHARGICKYMGIPYKAETIPTPTPTKKPVVAIGLYRVIKNGVQIGAYGDEDNILEAVKKSIADSSKIITIEKVEK